MQFNGAGMKTTIVSSMLLMSLQLPAETINFDNDTPGALPDDWAAGVTGPGAARWTVERDPTAPSAVFHSVTSFLPC
jgi:hypothetical protein